MIDISQGALCLLWKERLLVDEKLAWICITFTVLPSEEKFQATQQVRNDRSMVSVSKHQMHENLGASALGKPSLTLADCVKGISTGTTILIAFIYIYLN